MFDCESVLIRPGGGWAQATKSQVRTGHPGHLGCIPQAAVPHWPLGTPVSHLHAQALFRWAVAELVAGQDGEEERGEPRGRQEAAGKGGSSSPWLGWASALWPGRGAERALQAWASSQQLPATSQGLWVHLQLPFSGTSSKSAPEGPALEGPAP